MGVIERTPGVERKDEEEESVYTYSSRPTTPGDRKGLLVRFQLVNKTQPCVAYHYMSVSPSTKLSELRRPVNTFFKQYYDGGFIFLCKTKEITKDKERFLTIFDILPKMPHVEAPDRRPSSSFLYSDVKYKEVAHDIEGKRHMTMCACVVFLYERSKVSHWPPSQLREELSASMLDGFCFIPSDIMSWKQKLVESRSTSIHGYAACNKKKELETAIHQLPDLSHVPYIKDQRGAVPLHYAAENGHLEICECLVAAIGKDLIYQQDANLKTPLHCALYRRRSKTIVYLLQLNSDLVRPDIYGNTCIDLLLQQTNQDLDFIISKLQIDCIDDILKYYLACYAMKTGKVALSIELTEKLKLHTMKESIGESLLHIAVELGDKRVVENLIRNKFDLTQKDLTGYFPFHRACSRGRQELADLLFFNNMDHSDICKGVVLALRHNCHVICANIRTKAPTFVLDEITVCWITQKLDNELKKVDKESKTREKCLKDWENTLKNVLPLLQKEEGVLETYVFDCAYNDLPSSLILLKSLGANFNEKDFIGRTPLHEAVQQNSFKAMNILLKGNANPNTLDWRGCSALHYACSKGNLQCVKALLDKKAKADLQNASGRTPLLEAAYHRKREVVSYLVSNHADELNIHAIDSSGYSILHYLHSMPDKTVDLILETYSSTTKKEQGKIFKSALWKDSVKYSAWNRNVVASHFHLIKQQLDGLKSKFIDPETDKLVDGPFEIKHHSLTTWNSRKEFRFTDDVKLPSSPKIATTICKRCKKVFINKSHRCSRMAKRQFQGEIEIHTVKYRAFRFHFAYPQESISPAFVAASAGNITLVKKLIKFDPGFKNEIDGFGRNLLEVAIDNGSIKLLQTMLDLQQAEKNPSLIHRVLMQKKKSKTDNIRNTLLGMLIEKGHFVDDRLEKGKVSHDECVLRKGKFCHRQCYLKGYTPLEIVVRNNDEDLFKTIYDKSSGRNKTIPFLLAAYKGNHAMLEMINKKTVSQKKGKDVSVEEEDVDDKKSEEDMDERILLDIACRSPHTTIDIIKVICKLFPDMLEQNTAGVLTVHPSNRRYLQFDIPNQEFSETTSLAKLLSDNYPQKYRILSRRTIENIACHLIENGINLGCVFPHTHSKEEKNHKFMHGACEALLKAMEGRYYKVAENILQKGSSIVWKCALGSAKCRVQSKFKNKMFNRRRNYMHHPSYINYILMMACSENATKNVLQLLLQSGYPEYNKETQVNFDDLDEAIRSEVEKIEDKFLQNLICVTQLMAIKRDKSQNIYKLVHLFPNLMGCLKYVDQKLFKQPKGRNILSSFIHACVRLSISGRCGYSPVVVFGKHRAFHEYRPICLPDGLNLLHMFCTFDNTDYVKNLIKCGTALDVNKKSSNGIRAIDVAAACGNWNVFKFLLDEDADVDYGTLLACCSNGTYKGINIWIDRLRNIQEKENGSEKQRLKIVKELCKKQNVDLSYHSAEDGCHLGLALQAKFWIIAEYLCSVSATSVCHPLMRTLDCKSNNDWTLHAPKELLKTIVEASISESTSAVANLTYVLQGISKLPDTEFIEAIVRRLDNTITDFQRWLQLCRQTDTHGKNLLHNLCYFGHWQALTVITKRFKEDTDRKAIINHEDKASSSPLWCALVTKNWFAARHLLLLGSKASTKRAIPDFETFALCTSEKQEMAIKTNSENEKCWKLTGLRRFPKLSSSINVAESIAPMSDCFKGIPQSPQKENIQNNKTGKLTSTFNITGKDSAEKCSLKRLLKMALMAQTKGCDLIHAACSVGDVGIVKEILKLRPSALQLKDDQGFYPFAYAVFGGNQDVIEIVKNDLSREIARTSLEPLIWKLASALKIRRHFRAFSQLLGYIHHDSTPNKTDEASTPTEVRLPPFRWSQFNSEFYWHTILERHLQHFDVSDDVATGIRRDLTGVRDNIRSHNHIDTFLFLTTDETKTITEKSAESILSVLLSHMKTQDINRSNLITLLLLQKTWIMKVLLDIDHGSGITALLQKPIIWKYSVVDCLFILTCPDDPRLNKEGKSQLYTHGSVKKMLKQYEMNLSSGVEIYAMEKNLWLFLEHALNHAFETAGRLTDNWHTILAAAAEHGQMSFLRSMLDKLHIPRMTADQKSCFTAYLCLACRSGKTDVVKYLLRNNVPTVGRMDEYPIRDIVGKHHRKSWNILHYALHSKSQNTLKEILSVLKSEKEFVRNLDIHECIHESAKTGSPEIVSIMLQFISMTKNGIPPQSDFDSMLITGAKRGHEDLCVYLIEKKSANELTFDDKNVTPLHYCACFKMEKLANIILQIQPSALEKKDMNGLTPYDYAHALGCPHLFKEGPLTRPQESTECNGWLRCLLEANAQNGLAKTEVVISPHKRMLNDRGLTLVNLLQRYDDIASSMVVSGSRKQIKLLADREPSECINIFSSAAIYGCNKALNGLCNIFNDLPENAQKLKNLLMKNHKHERTKCSLTPLGWAIYVKNMDAIDMLMNIEPCSTWTELNTGENILHLAVKTESFLIVQRVNEKSKGKHVWEADKGKLTPIAYAVALGLHKIFRYLIKNQITFPSSSHDKHYGDRMDYSCVECLLDHCIGWSKNYHSRDYEYTQAEEVLRSIFQRKNTRGYVSQSVRTIPGLRQNIVSKVSKIPYELRSMCSMNEDQSSFKLHKIHIINSWSGSNSNFVKSALFSMGYKAEEETLQWMSIRSLTDPFEAASKSVRMGFLELAVKFVPQLKDYQVRDLLEIAAVHGKEYILEKCQERLLSLMNYETESESLIESMVAFGQTNPSIRILKLAAKSGLTETFSTFRDIKEAVPQKILWLSGIQTPGDNEWLADIESDNRLNHPDIWLSMKDSTALSTFIEERINIETLLPDTCRGKKLISDIESFKKHPCYRENGDIWVRCFIASSQVFGNACELVDTCDSKPGSVNSVRMTCLPPGSSDHPKVTLETTGLLQDSMSVATYNDKAVLQHDVSITTRAVETKLKETILTDTIPALEQQLREELGMSVHIKVDWNSVDARKRTNGTESIMKVLSGDHFHNELGGLQDVIADCIDIKTTIETLFNEETVKLALQPVSGLKTIIVSFVDSLPASDGQQRSRFSQTDSYCTWRFVLDRSTVKYDRSTFPVWYYLNKYRSACVAFCDSAYRMCNKTTDWSPVRKKKPITLEVDWNSFISNNDQMLISLIGHEIARELSVMAYEREAMLRLELSSDHVVVRNTPTALYTGITFQGKFLIASICVHQTTKNNWVVENGKTSSKLADLEDKQLIEKWPNDMFPELRKLITDTKQRITREFGTNIDILLDEKRILGPLLMACRRELTHPHKIIPNAVKKYLSLLPKVYCNAFWHVFSGPNTSCSKFVRKLDVQAGVWKPYTKVSRSSKAPLPEQLLKIKKTKSRKQLMSGMRGRLTFVADYDYVYHYYVENYNYADKFKLQIVSPENHKKGDLFGRTWEFAKPTSAIINKNLSSLPQIISFVSYEGKVHEILDQNALIRIISKFPNKAVMGNDLLENFDSGASYRLYLKLFPTLHNDLKTCSRSTAIPLLQDTLCRVNYLHGFLHIPNVIVDWDQLFDFSSSSPTDDLRCVQRAIRILEDSLHDVYRKETNICDPMPKISRSTIRKIMGLSLTKMSENFKPDVSTLRIIKFKEQGLPEIHLRHGNMLTIAYHDFKNLSKFTDLFLTAMVHLLEIEIKLHIEKGIAKNTEKEKWRKKQYDGPEQVRPQLCFVERLLPRVLSGINEVMHISEGKEYLESQFVDFQFATSSSNKTEIDIIDGWIICYVSEEDIGANIYSLLRRALEVKSDGTLLSRLMYKDTSLHYTSRTENTMEVKILGTKIDEKEQAELSNAENFRVQVSSNSTKLPPVTPDNIVLDTTERTIQIKWKGVHESGMGQVQLQFKNEFVDFPRCTYFHRQSQLSDLAENGKNEQEFLMQKNGHMLVLVDHDSSCCVNGRYELKELNQRVKDLEAGVKVESRYICAFLIKAKKRTYKQPIIPVKFTTMSHNESSMCVKVTCLDRSRKVSIRARCSLCGNMMKIITPSGVIPPGNHMIINP